ncbi:MAG TPA: alpha-amylase family glycosyl hydrolase, partial [Rectinemataceae bacterium]|nr:alpha-amylase family glycosyl hydrolase [Rectinemataceae bacterium]
MHILPPFPSSADRGFAPISYSCIDPAFGSWTDVEDIGREHYLTLDLMVNHISRQSEYCRDFLDRGRASPWADLFLTLDKIWTTGQIPPKDAALLAHRRLGPPYVELLAGGKHERVWSTFGPEGCSEQLDIDVRSPAARQLLKETLAGFAAHGVKMVRLDAVGYVTKKAGTSCFFV